MVASLAAAGSAAGLGGPFYAGVAGVGCHLAWQVGTVDLRSPADCASKFASNAGLGLAVAAAVAAGRLASGG